MLDPFQVSGFLCSMCSHVLLTIRRALSVLSFLISGPDSAFLVSPPPPFHSWTHRVSYRDRVITEFIAQIITQFISPLNWSCLVIPRQARARLCFDEDWSSVCVCSFRHCFLLAFHSFLFLTCLFHLHSRFPSRFCRFDANQHSIHYHNTTIDQWVSVCLFSPTSVFFSSSHSFNFSDLFIALVLQISLCLSSIRCQLPRLRCQRIRLCCIAPTQPTVFSPTHA